MNGGNTFDITVSTRCRGDLPDLSVLTMMGAANKSLTSLFVFYFSIRFRCKIERNELMEINRRQSECLRMLEDEYKKLDEDHQRLQKENEDLVKKKLS